MCVIVWICTEYHVKFTSPGYIIHAVTESLSNRAFNIETPDIQCTGLPIEWGNAGNYNNGLALGDTFYFSEETDDLNDNSGWYRIIGIEQSWDDNGVDTVQPKLLRVE